LSFHTYIAISKKQVPGCPKFQAIRSGCLVDAVEKTSRTGWMKRAFTPGWQTNFHHPKPGTPIIDTPQEKLELHDYFTSSSQVNDWD